MGVFAPSERRTQVRKRLSVLYDVPFVAEVAQNLADAWEVVAQGLADDDCLERGFLSVLPTECTIWASSWRR